MAWRLLVEEKRHVTARSGAGDRRRDVGDVEGNRARRVFVTGGERLSRSADGWGFQR